MRESNYCATRRGEKDIRVLSAVRLTFGWFQPTLPMSPNRGLQCCERPFSIDGRHWPAGFGIHWMPRTPTYRLPKMSPCLVLGDRYRQLKFWLGQTPSHLTCDRQQVSDQLKSVLQLLKHGVFQGIMSGPVDHGSARETGGRAAETAAWSCRMITTPSRYDKIRLCTRSLTLLAVSDECLEILTSNSILSSSLWALIACV